GALRARVRRASSDLPTRDSALRGRPTNTISAPIAASTSMTMKKPPELTTVIPPITRSARQRGVDIGEELDLVPAVRVVLVPALHEGLAVHFHVGDGAMASALHEGLGGGRVGVDID